MRSVMILFCLLALCGCVRAPERPQKAYGRVDFETSCSDEAQAKIAQGVALLHHRMYSEAERVFFATAAIDAECAIAQWGIAMARARLGWPSRPTADDLTRGTAALARARQIGGSAREQAWVEAVAAYYDAGGDDEAGLAAWSRAQAGLSAAYPKDIDAAAFHALSRLTQGAGPGSAQREAIGTELEELLRRAPEHPGALLYLVLAYDHPRLASRAEAAAGTYAEVCREIPYANHVPTKLDQWAERWRPMVAGNLSASAAAAERPVNGATSLRFAQTVDYLMYAYLQGGWDRRAQAVLDHKIVRVKTFQDDFVSAWSLAALRARHALERGDWATAAALPLDPPPGITGELYPAVRGLTLFARGLGAARSGDAAAAHAARQELESLEVAQAHRFRIEAWSATLGAWIALAEGRTDEALNEMRRAAAVEESAAVESYWPGPPRPLRELLGEMLLETGDPAEALAAFEATLENAPGRFNGLLGAARAARRAEDDATARRHYQQLIDGTAESGSQHPGLIEAREFLGPA